MQYNHEERRLHDAGKDAGCYRIFNFFRSGAGCHATPILRFTFREDGSGIQEQIIKDGRHPNANREFAYRLKEDRLTLDYGDGQREDFPL